LADVNPENNTLEVNKIDLLIIKFASNFKEAIK
jgi:hypothetical protein